MFDEREIPFPAYEGDEPYIHVIYAHMDKNAVFHDLKIFHNEGYNIYYDQGISLGMGEPEDIERSLSNCSLAVAFISKISVDSHNVLVNIRFALERNIPLLPIYLEETQLPQDLMFSLGMARSILKFVMSDEDYIEMCKGAFDEYGLK